MVREDAEVGGSRGAGDCSSKPPASRGTVRKGQDREHVPCVTGGVVSLVLKGGGLQEQGAGSTMQGELPSLGGACSRGAGMKGSDRQIYCGGGAGRTWEAQRGPCSSVSSTCVAVGVLTSRQVEG